MLENKETVIYYNEEKFQWAHRYYGTYVNEAKYWQRMEFA